MKNIPEINHCSPNPKAWWCPSCKAHNTFEIVSRGSGVLYHCKAGCGLMKMFKPGEVLPWRNGLSIFVGLSFFLALLLGVEPLSKGTTFNYSRPLQIAVIVGLNGFFFGLIAWSMAHYLKKWSAWSSAQRRKSPEELKQEALDHPFQPEYDSSTDFTYWAEQFLSSEEVEQMHEKYGGGGEEESPPDPGAPWFEGEEDAPSVPPPGADQEDAE